MEKQIITVSLTPAYKAKRGHQARLAGQGTHKDRRTKRQRTRSAQRRQVFKDWS